MTDKQIIEAMARLDGFSEYEMRWWVDGSWCGRSILPAYLTSHDAVQRVIDGLSGSQLPVMYGTYLCNVMHVNANHDYTSLFRATPRQKCEAILKAVGKEV